MRLSTLLGPDLKAVLARGEEALRAALEDVHAEDIAEIIEDLELEDAVTIVRSLPADRAADVVERLPTEIQIAVLGAIGHVDAAEILVEVDPDDRVDLVQELDESQRESVLAALEEREPEIAEEVRELVGYDPETAGGLMTTELVQLGPETTVAEAIAEIRRLSDEDEAETVYYVYVVGYGGRLLGVVSLRDLILAKPGATLSQIMTEKVITVHPGDHQEEVANLMARYDFTALPVVDDHGVLLGLVTVDDVVDVVIEEATEDAQKQGGVVPLEDSYFATSLREFVWKRGSWLVVLFMGQLLTATVMRRYDSLLAQTVDLVIFIPLIIATGGNAGSQSSTLVIRGMTLGEISPGDWLRVVAKEITIGLALGVLLAGLGFLRAFLEDAELDAFALSSAVATSIVAVVTLASVVGSVLPMALKRLGFDPAVSSTPFIASVVDVMGLMVYFGVATLILHLAY
ncbi:MAG: magnesium transporter [Myxococcales bacterium]|nr:magnesium transporter [Myxococcales bacterium]